ncbi:restriction endonuclease subunit S [Pseudomonas sp. CA3A]|uniref:Restriction endonuclease subunit S n=2 Tax=Pseudomonas typographi TaxID=2715964 RepID=A0ABR7Z6W6_9PSED|nr:restriction endonuclease subunit S [Pseudomonas typographi]
MTTEMVELDELMVRRNGSVNPAKFVDEEFELHSIPAFDAGRPDFVNGSQIGSSKQVVQPNDVMISKIIPHIRRASVVGASSGRRQIASGEWIVFRSERVFPNYLRQVLVSDDFNAKFMNTVAGVGGSLLRARPAEVAKIKIPLPPLPEQRRIAAILDKADALRAKRREAIAKLDQLLQSVFLEMFGDPVTNPNKFIVKPLGDVATQVTDGAHHTPERTTHGIPLLSARNVLMGSLKFTNTDFVGQEEYERLRKRCEPKKGDILISCSGSIGRVSVVRTDLPFVLVRSAALVKLDPALVTPTFMEHQLRTPYLQGQMLMSAKSSSQANLFQAPIRALRVLVPPIALQNQFEKVANNVAKRHAELLEAEKLTDSLFFSIQGQAFSGKLFP